MSSPDQDSPTRQGLIEELLGQLARMSGLSVLFSHAIAERIGLNPTDLESLEILLREGPVPAGRLAERTGLTTGAITGVIDRLERAGYVRREPDPGDRRRVIVAVERETVERELMPLYAGMQQATTALVTKLGDRDLELFIGFIRDANAVAAAQIDQVRVRPGSGAKLPPAS